MDLWYSEYHAPTVKFSIQIKSQLHHEVTEHQTIFVFDSEEFGRFFYPGRLYHDDGAG